MTDEEMKQLLVETMKAQFEADSFSDELPARATPRPPATWEEIWGVEEHLRARNLSLPPSFAQFLRIHNGIDDYIPSIGLSICSTHFFDDAKEEVTSGLKFVFASGDTGSIAEFLPETKDSRGEMQVLMVTEWGASTQYENFDEFLKDQLEYYLSVIRGERRRALDGQAGASSA